MLDAEGIIAEAEATVGIVDSEPGVRRNLERLAQFGSFAEAVADARAHRIEAITPWIETRDGEERLCIPEGLGYPVTSQPVKAASRA